MCEAHSAKHHCCHPRAILLGRRRPARALATRAGWAYASRRKARRREPTIRRLRQAGPLCLLALCLSPFPVAVVYALDIGPSSAVRTNPQNESKEALFLPPVTIPEGAIYHLSAGPNWIVVNAMFNAAGWKLIIKRSQRADCAGPSHHISEFCELYVEGSQERWGLPIVSHVHTKIWLAEYCDSIAAPTT